MKIPLNLKHITVISGSPFVIKVTAQPDASKVRVVGPGVEHGILATFVSRFIVETKGAGAGQLTVRIRGPKGKYVYYFIAQILSRDLSKC